MLVHYFIRDGYISQLYNYHPCNDEQTVIFRFKHQK